MAESTLQDRLRDHSKAFDSLLSLIPADVYYGKGDTSEQWSKKKQTKEQRVAAKRARLDPDSAKSAKDIMDEKARKRKLEEAEGSDNDNIEKERPKQGLKAIKKQKTSENASKQPAMPKVQETEEEKTARLEANKLRKLEVKAKLAKKAEAKKAKKQSKAAESVNLGEDDEDKIHVKVDGLEADVDTTPDVNAKNVPQRLPESREQNEVEAEKINFSGLIDAEDAQPEDLSTASQSPIQSPTFDNANEPSTNTSTTSTVPPTTTTKHIRVSVDPEILRQRLNARIESLRAARKADGPNGQPARNRQELMESRRKKEEERRAHKKELRRQQRHQEDAEREQALASARDSPASSLMSPAIHTANQDNFSFSRVAFADGAQLAADLTRLQSAPRKKGPSDPKTALAAAQKNASRIASLDDNKRADIEEKELWSQAKKRAHGEKVRDDTSLLKKTLKRKEKQKKKSEKEWVERKEGVAKSQALKQKKRTENLQARRDGSKKGKAKAGKSAKTPTKKKSRPGFEGSFGGNKKK